MIDRTKSACIRRTKRTTGQNVGQEGQITREEEHSTSGKVKNTKLGGKTHDGEAKKSRAGRIKATAVGNEDRHGRPNVQHRGKNYYREDRKYNRENK